MIFGNFELRSVGTKWTKLAHLCSVMEGLYFTAESHANFNPSQITDQYNTGTEPKST